MKIMQAAADGKGQATNVGWLSYSRELKEHVCDQRTLRTLGKAQSNRAY